MMMSLFSSFEALWADSYGQKMKFSGSTEQAKPKKVSCLEGSKKETDKNSSSPANIKKPQQLLRPRFAAELDGVHCFETIIPY
ncbi:hypothetical protein QUC31_008388 [Theobroma cacao]|uniref:Uncharacterized protein LOC18605856 n=2 Tax=Theobroma cacao TaxID=3641 RepID=A0AB32VBQ8_THECC|nr:PREDICTED: uncharacterized protein LOC18605856 [Theobroma cacao]EOY23698.1 Uncharacterized protein TCM_015506 [Theobroma cacao]WRX18775.1 hypothetical protein QQP08_011262 [Theobroma cacao]